MRLQELTLANKAIGSVVAVGNFDGVHLGHVEIIRTVKERAAEKNLRPVLITFDPHPIEVLRGVQIKKLVTVEKKIELFQAQGVPDCFCLTFDHELAAMSAEDFLLVLIERLGMRMLILGETSHLGNNREGTPEKLRVILAKHRVDTQIVPSYQPNGQVISSSYLRQSLQRGDVAEVRRCLGRYYETEGNVVQGHQLGRKIGFPTLNVFNPSTMTPARGVYATYTWFDGRKARSVTNVGTRPTFHENASEVIETHLFEETLEHAPEKITIEWIGRLRDEKKFESSIELQRQIQLDIAAAKSLLPG